MFLEKWTGFLRLAVAVATSFAALPAAHASTITFGTYDLTVSNAFGTDTFGYVTVSDLGGATAQFTVDVAPNFVLDTGSHFALTFSLDGAASVVTDSFSSSHFSVVSGGGPFSNAPFGTFTSAIQADCKQGNCGPTLTSSFSFDVSNFSGLNPATGLFNGLPVLFAVDVFNTGCTGRACTGVVGAPVPVHSVPGPIVGAGLPGLVVACGCLLALARRRRQRLA